MFSRSFIGGHLEKRRRRDKSEHARLLWGFQSRTSAASLQLELGRSRFQEIFVDQILSFRYHSQLWDPQFKLSDNDPTSRTVALKNLFVVILQPKIAN